MVLLLCLLFLLGQFSLAENPVVVLVALDGFRYGYQDKGATPNLHRIASKGVEAQGGLISVFPTGITGLWTLVTGLYPAWHGVVDFHFGLPYSNTNQSAGSNPRFDFNTDEPSWWLGTPVWETVLENNGTAAVYGMTGAQVPKGKWRCKPPTCVNYQDALNLSLSPSDRVHLGLQALDHNASFVVIYIEDVDTEAHSTGPDSVQVTNAVLEIDAALGELLEGIEQRGLAGYASIIVTGDHGMVATCKERHVPVDDLGIPTAWVEATGGTLSVRPPPGVNVADFAKFIKEKQASVSNGEHIHIYLKENLPKRLFFWQSDRIAPIIGMLDEGYKALIKEEAQVESCGGHHRYDNAYASMNTIFIASGPRFKPGHKVPPFSMVEVYNVIVDLLGIQGVPNNGTKEFANSVLLPNSVIKNTARTASLMF